MRRIKSLWLKLDESGRIMLLMIPAILSGIATAILSQSFNLSFLATIGVGSGFLAVVIIVGLPLTFIPEVRGSKNNHNSR